eukprot:scaffold249_cov405-Prasinococcus_capsulatus_cf.AAC.9
MAVCAPGMYVMQYLREPGNVCHVPDLLCMEAPRLQSHRGYALITVTARARTRNMRRIELGRTGKPVAQQG